MDCKTGLTTKDKVLLYLKQTDGFVSGEDISDKLLLSRAAVNACVKSLRAEGYEIESVTRRGYRLLRSPDVLSPGEIAFYLQDSDRATQICCLNETTSTNNVLLSTSMGSAPTGTVVIADSQTAGRGRMGRAFYSPKGKSVYLSYLIRPLSFLSAVNQPDSTPLLASAAANDFKTQSVTPSLHTSSHQGFADNLPVSSPAAWTSITCKTAVTITNAIEHVSGLRPRIKWVNDLYWDERKITGILTQMDIEPESAHVRSIVIGIGVNANGKIEDFPEELRDIAGTVENAVGNKICRARLAAEMIKELDLMVRSVPASSDHYLEQYRKDCFVIGKQVTILTPGHGGRVARALEITDDFALRVRYEDGRTEDLNGGEISIRI